MSIAPPPESPFDPLPTFTHDHQLAQISSGPGEPNDEDYSVPHLFVDDIKEAHVLNSEQKGTGLHRPVLDIDFPVTVIPSTTPGHGHLYIDKPMSWTRYKKLLLALEAAGIIQPGYVDASVERGYTSVRLPWIKKSKESPA